MRIYDARLIVQVAQSFQILINSKVLGKVVYLYPWDLRLKFRRRAMWLVRKLWWVPRYFLLLDLKGARHLLFLPLKLHSHEQALKWWL
ncbi:hypothetical protein AMTR_s00017p00057650 [Amborella trichopoda]|uniref:Uncharacterized protein n=1 Tax=Amborella trichopoda TaxID=13333 RepID=W1PMY9_AMBTC|nr:hypothetical protein AMTR_s00017p00057650 [Amborella trichopoda]